MILRPRSFAYPIEIVLECLASNPRIGQVRSELPTKPRSFAVGTYVIFCRERQDIIEIIRVLSGYRDLDTLLGGKSGGG